MSTVSVSLPSDGTTADVADYNTPITSIVNMINGGLDNSNIVSGAAIATSKLADDAGITTAKLGAASVTPVKLATGADSAVVLTQETTTSTSYTDLTTTTDTVTVTIGANGIALVSIYATFANSGANYTNVSFAVSGATTVAAADTLALSHNSTNFFSMGATFLVKSLTAGSNTFKLKYDVVSGTGTFKNRRISVVPL